MQTQKRKTKAFFNQSFLHFLIGFIFGVGSVIGFCLIAAYFLFPKNYQFQLMIGPDISEKSDKFSYQLQIENDFSADSSVSRLGDFGKFPASLDSIDEWLDQKSPSVSDSDKIKVVTVGRIYCSYCLDLYPYLELMHNRYKGKVSVVGILFEQYQDELDEEKVRQAVADRSVTFQVGIDRDKVFTDSLWERAFPVTYVIDQNNTIVLKRFGLADFDRIDEMLQILTKQSE